MRIFFALYFNEKYLYYRKYTTNQSCLSPNLTILGNGVGKTNRKRQFLYFLFIFLSFLAKSLKQNELVFIASNHMIAKGALFLACFLQVGRD